MGSSASGGRHGGLGAVLHTSVATLYSNLVTRPTGRAVRVAIEQQIQGARGPCLCVLDFSQVRIIDYSCADEVIAKLLLAHRRGGDPCEAYFIAKGVSRAQRDPIETVLRRHGLLLVALEAGRTALWGPAPPRLRSAWDSLDRLGGAHPDEFASHSGLKRSTAASWLRRLVEQRVAVADAEERYVSLPALLDRNPAFG